jgi:rhamnulokinase
VLAASASTATPRRALIDPDDERFVSPGDMPDRIGRPASRGAFLRPRPPGEHARVVLESLAHRYRELLEELERVTRRALPTIRIVGGGARNRLLCQLTADATGRTVIAGPVEATALGNAGVQLMALGRLGGIDDLRAVVERSTPVETYEPSAERGAWDEAHGRFRQLTGRDHLDVELVGEASGPLIGMMSWGHEETTATHETKAAITT